MAEVVYGADVPLTRIKGAGATTDRPRLPLGEDWLAVWLGGFSIAIVLAGVRPALPAFAWAGAADLTRTVFGLQNVSNMLVAGAIIGILGCIGILLMKESVARFAVGFPAIFALACGALLIAGNRTISGWGLEYVIFAFLLGLAISNSVGVPSWLNGAVRTEFYIKIGLVILGASILFDDLVQAGLLGIAQALLVVTAVWFVCFRLARMLKVDDEFATMLASAVSICGVSAAIATCGAIQGDRQKLSYVTSLVLVVAVPMMIVMPWISRAVGMPDVVAGAWLGGTLDTSAAVVAAGELVSDQARNAAVVVKLSQNVLIGVAAFLLTIWWAMRRGGSAAGSTSAAVIWDRFPKFVLGFLAVSLIFSFALTTQTVSDTRGLLTAVRTAWFALAFLSIGLETSISDLVKTGGGRPVAAFLGGQLFNIVITLVLAYLLFGGVLFPAPVFN